MVAATLYYGGRQCGIAQDTNVEEWQHQMFNSLQLNHRYNTNKYVNIVQYPAIAIAML